MGGGEGGGFTQKIVNSYQNSMHQVTKCVSMCIIQNGQGLTLRQTLFLFFFFLLNVVLSCVGFSALICWGLSSPTLHGRLLSQDTSTISCFLCLDGKHEVMCHIHENMKNVKVRKYDYKEMLILMRWLTGSLKIPQAKVLPSLLSC